MNKNTIKNNVSCLVLIIKWMLVLIGFVIALLGPMPFLAYPGSFTYAPVQLVWLALFTIGGFSAMIMSFLWR